MQRITLDFDMHTHILREILEDDGVSGANAAVFTTRIVAYYVPRRSPPAFSPTYIAWRAEGCHFSPRERR